MIERALNSVKQTGEAINQALPDRGDSVSAFEQVQSKRANKKEIDGSNSTFQIKKSFSNGANILAKTIGQFNKALNLLEVKTGEEESEGQKAPITNKINDNALPVKSSPSVPQVPADSAKNNAPDGQQLELDLFDGADPNSFKEQSKPSIEVKKFSNDPIQKTTFVETPNIDIGLNPSNFKIHTIITDEIIKAISNSSTDLNIKDVGEHLASKLANEVKKQLASQPHAIATNQGTAPLRTLDQSA